MRDRNGWRWNDFWRLLHRSSYDPRLELLHDEAQFEASVCLHDLGQEHLRIERFERRKLFQLCYGQLRSAAWNGRNARNVGFPDRDLS